MISLLSNWAADALDVLHDNSLSDSIEGTHSSSEPCSMDAQARLLFLRWSGPAQGAHGRRLWSSCHQGATFHGSRNHCGPPRLQADVQVWQGPDHSAKSTHWSPVGWLRPQDRWPGPCMVEQPGSVRLIDIAAMATCMTHVSSTFLALLCKPAAETG